MAPDTPGHSNSDQLDVHMFVSRAYKSGLVNALTLAAHGQTLFHDPPDTIQWSATADTRSTTSDQATRATRPVATSAVFTAARVFAIRESTNWLYPGGALEGAFGGVVAVAMRSDSGG